MASSNIPSLPATPTLNGTEELWAVQSGSDVRVTVGQIVSLANGEGAGAIPVPSGGTGATSFNQNALLVGEGASPLQDTGAGTTGQLLAGLTSGKPVWLPAGTTGQFLTANTSGQPTFVTVTPGAQVTDIGFGSTGLTPSAQTSGSVTVAGTLNVANGGTGNDTLTANAVLLGNGTSATSDTGAGAAGQLLVGVNSSAPKWFTAGTSGQILQTNGAGSDPAWVNLPGTGVATISFGSTGLTPSTATSGVVTVAGTLGTAHGGTNLTGFTAANNAVYSTSSSALTAGTLPTAAGGTALTGFTAANNAIYSTSSTALTAGTLPVLAGGTGTTTATGSGSVVLSASPVLATPTLTAPIVTALNGNSLGGKRNRLINGGMMVDQRNAGASQTITAGAALAYTVDRFYGYCTGANVTGQQIASAGAGSSPSLNAYRFTGAASVTGIGFAQRVEAANSFDLAGNSVTISAVLSNSVLTTVTWTLYYANSKDTFGTLASPTVTSISTGVWTVNSTPTVYSATISVPGAATTGLQLLLTVGAQTSGTWTVGNVQLEPGTEATPFERLSMQEILSDCQRYLPAFRDGGSGTDELGMGFQASSTLSQGTVAFPVTTRAPATGIVATSGSAFAVGGNIATSVSFNFGGVSAGNVAGVISGGVAGNAGNFRFNSAGAFLYFTGCEL